MNNVLGAVVQAQLAAFAAIFLAFGPTSAATVGPADCALPAADRRWLDEALAAWTFVAGEKLKIGKASLPTVVTFDRRCTYTLPAHGNRHGGWSGMRHEGSIRLPNGNIVAVAPIAAAVFMPSNGEKFFVMSMPEIWHLVGQRAPLGMEVSLQSVMIHELTHTYHLPLLTPTFETIGKRYDLPAGTDDDSLQHSFKDSAAYVADFESERDVLFRSAFAAETRDARRLACEGLAKLRSRRSRYFTGANEKWAALDDYYLTMEGVAEWARYAWLIDRRGKGIDSATVLSGRGSGSWTQDEGLALFLVIDRLVPGWQRLAFAHRPEMAESLLGRACG